jgi:hypothetical protein
MCFSSGASFGVGTLLLFAGITAISKTRSISHVPFAAIPILFSIQQFIEGFIWLSLINPSFLAWNHPATMGFLVFAQVVWPTWVPLSILLLESDKQRKNVLIGITSMGILLSFYLAYCLIQYRATSEIYHYHILYNLSFPEKLITISSVFYFIATIVPSFLSSVKNTLFLGVVILASFIVTKLFFHEYIISIWCFFAAVISVIIIKIMPSAQSISFQLTATRDLLIKK